MFKVKAGPPICFYRSNSDPRLSPPEDTRRTRVCFPENPDEIAAAAESARLRNITNRQGTVFQQILRFGQAQIPKAMRKQDIARLVGLVA